MNRLVKVLEAGELAAEYAYDINGNRRLLRYPNGVEVTYRYNDANLVIELENRHVVDTRRPTFEKRICKANILTKTLLQRYSYTY